MKKSILSLLLLLVSPLLWAQAESLTIDEIDMDDVVVIEDVEPVPDGVVKDPVAEVVAPEAGPNEDDLAGDSAAETELEGDATAPAETDDGSAGESVEQDAEDPAVETISDEAEAPAADTEKAVIEFEPPEIPAATGPLPDADKVVLEIPEPEQESEGEATKESEETVSLDFPDEDVRNILRNVADLYDLNLIIPDTLQGRTSIKLKNVTWQDVFEVVLEPFGFTYTRVNNIIRIKSVQDLTMEPVDTTVFIVDFARAADIRNSIAPLIDGAGGGQIQVDTRSNALVITERPSRMNKIGDIIKRLDKPTEQVMIETRFIEVSNRDIKNIGVNWTSLSGYEVRATEIEREWERNRESSSSTNNTSNVGGTSSVTTNSSSLTPNDVVTGVEELTSDISRGGVSDSIAGTSRLDSAVFSADDFRVILSALKENTDSKLVSNPTVVVMNNQEAVFEVGEDFPVREIRQNQETGAFEAGAKDEVFIGISLNVTPSVNRAGMINLAVNPVLSNLDRTIENFGAIDPVIGKRSVNTNVSIKDGFTLALGGLTTKDESDEGTKVPLLGDLPGLGRLFRSDSKEIAQTNLIVFITAKTLNPDGSDYREIIDPRKLNAMGITEEDIPGYEPPAAEVEAMRQSEQLRLEHSLNERLSKLREQIRTLENLPNAEDER